MSIYVAISDNYRNGQTMGSNVHIMNIGCNRRGLDATRLISYFEANDCYVVSDPKDADYIMLFTCGYKKSREDESLDTIHNLLKYDAELILLGCLPAIDLDAIKKSFHRQFLSTKDLENIDEFFPKFRVRFKDIPDANFPSGQVYGKSDDVGIIRIAWGCRGKCSYCAIRFATGRLKSKPISIIKNEYRSLLDKGFRNIIINAEDTGAYGMDVNSSFSELLRELFSISSSKDILWDIQTLSPQYAIKYLDTLVELIGAGIICRIKCDVQSGNERILRLMNRYSDLDRIRSLFVEFRKTNPKTHLTSQFIVGFPTETQRDFLDTIDLMKELVLTSYEIFPYSDRVNTLSSRMDGKIPENIITKRMEYLHEAFYGSGYEIVGDSHKVYLNQLL